MKTLHGLCQNQLTPEILKFQLCFFFFFLVMLNIFLTIPVVIVNIKVKDASAIPAGIPTTVACDTKVKVPKDADSVIKGLSA